MNLAFYGLDKWGRPNMPPFNKMWVEDGGYKGFLWRMDENKFYFNDIPTQAENYYYALTRMAFEKKELK